MTDRELMQQALEDAYLAGFNDSAEGYNGEYPFRDHGATPLKDRHWIERRDAYIRTAIHATELREQAEKQEPVAWVLTAELDKRETTTRAHLWFSNPQNCMWTPIYTTPPAAQPADELERERAIELSRAYQEGYARAIQNTTPPSAQREWVGLTRNEAMEIINSLVGQDWMYAVDAIEAKLKEKNT